MFESLESRQLFSGGGVPLVINGTSGPDTILITQNATQIVVNQNGVITTHAKSWIIPSPSQYIPPSYGFISGIQINGYDGADTIKSDDTVTSPETIIGGAGTDSLQGGHGNDVIYAGLGTSGRGASLDTSAYDTLDGGAGNDMLYCAPNGIQNKLWGGIGNDMLVGGNGAGELHGGADNDVISTTLNYITVYGDAGNDTINATCLSGTFYGGAGNDVITVGSGMWGTTHASISGDSGNDTISAAGYDTISGGGDDDVIKEKGGGGTINGNDGKDNITVYSSFAATLIDGGAGNDSITTDQSNDTLIGGLGNDFLDAGTGKNYLWGLDGNDTMAAGNGTDTFFGGTGTDLVSYASRTNPVTVTLDNTANDGESGENDYVAYDVEGAIGGAASDTFTGNSTNNKFFGGPGNDSIRAGNGADSVWGEAGNDTVYGEGSDDLLVGGDDNDLLYGGMGSDALYGGDGQDTLVSIGGDGVDWNYGQGGLDSIWEDTSNGDQNDATPDEVSGKRLHNVAKFLNTNQLDPTHPNLADPKADSDKGGYTNNGLLDNSPLFPSGGPNINDIRQQMLGDCYYMSVLGALAKAKPDIIRESIVDLGDHTFAVRFFDSKHNPVYVRVDDDVPVAPKNGKAIYAGTGMQGSIWAAMMEKAFVYEEHGASGEYEDIAGGFPQDVFPKFNLTSLQWGHWYQAASFQQISTALSQGKAVVAVTDYGSFDHGDKVVLSHVYDVMSVDVVGKTITLRNPWGTDAGGSAKDKDWNDGTDDGYVTLTLAEWQDNFGSSYGAVV